MTARVPDRKPRFRDGLLMYMAVGLGAAIGGVLRAAITLAAVAQLGSGFPWGTLAANVIGSFVIGVYAALTRPGGRLRAGARLNQFVMTGLCGGFTTFSVFSLETYLLAAGGDLRLAGLNLAGSVVAWLLAVWAGFSVALRVDQGGGGGSAASPPRGPDQRRARSPGCAAPADRPRRGRHARRSPPCTKPSC